MTSIPSSTDVAIIGAGQAGLSLSRCLTDAGIEHLVLERGAIAQSWRTQRWDSFSLVTPNWTVRLAGWRYDGEDPDGFMSGTAVVECLEAYARSFSAPVLTGVDVVGVSPNANGWRVEIATGDAIQARAVVVATATHRYPRPPAFALEGEHAGDVHALHASDYRNPEVLPPGGVLVVGSGQSGAQIAEELNEAGRDVVLATSRVGRLPRRYRGRDAIAWQADLGFLDRPASALNSPAARFNPDPHLSGKAGGRTLDLRRFAAQGITLAGRVQAVLGRSVRFDDTLHENIRWADRFAAEFAETVDEYIVRTGSRAPTPDPRDIEPYQSVWPRPLKSARLGPSGISTIVWATGFRYDFGWVKASPVFDEFGYPRQQASRTAAPGLHFLGLNYLEHRRSGILYGAGVDAEAMGRVLAEDLGHAPR